MRGSKISGVRIAGIACAVPEKRQTLVDDVFEFSKEEIETLSKTTGVKHRHISPDSMCTSDLCHAASEQLFLDSKIDKDSIDVLIFVTQTPDYIIPATSCILQNRLGLSKDCAAIQINLGCSGYPYGIWVASNFIFSGAAKKVLLVVGDTANKPLSQLDRSTALLFGDAGAATILESCDKEESMTFVLGTDGEGYKNLIIPAGSFRNPSTESTKKQQEAEGGNIRSQEHLYMNGGEIFTFTLKVVAPMIHKLLEESGSIKEDIDFFVMHQANSFIIKHLAKKLKVPLEKVPICMENFGNTSSASIPLTILESIGEQVKKGGLKLVLAGFGVGYSWAAVELNLKNIVLSDIVLVK